MSMLTGLDLRLEFSNHGGTSNPRPDPLHRSCRHRSSRTAGTAAAYATRQLGRQAVHEIQWQQA